MLFVTILIQILGHFPCKAGHAYTYTTDTCIVPPATPNSISETTSGQYVLACVVWNPSSFAELEQMTELLGKNRLDWFKHSMKILRFAPIY